MTVENDAIKLRTRVGDDTLKAQQADGQSREGRQDEQRHEPGQEGAPDQAEEARRAGDGAAHR